MASVIVPTARNKLFDAWANFDGTTANNLNGTYSQSGFTVTVNAVAHGQQIGSIVNSDITTGTGVDGTYVVTFVIDADNFTYTAGTSLTTSGNVTLRRRLIRDSLNCSSIAYIGAGNYGFNFTEVAIGANYCVFANNLNGAFVGVQNTLTNPTTGGFITQNKIDDGGGRDDTYNFIGTVRN